MKTKISATLVLMVMLLSLSQPAAAKFRFGLKAGANLSQLNHDALKSSNRCGFLAGAVVEYKIPVIPLGFDLSALYDQRNVEVINPDDGMPMNSKLQFASIPLNVRCPISLTKMFQLAAFTGPQCDLPLSNKKILEQNFRLQDATWSWNVGASLRIFKHYQIGYTYNIGITRIAKLLPNANINSSSELRNNTHQVCLAYFF